MDTPVEQNLQAVGLGSGAPEFDLKAHLKENNKFIFAVLIIDMDDEVRDVVGVLHLCALSGDDAAKRAFLLGQQQGIIKPDGKYYITAGILGALPDVPRSKIIQPNMSAIQKVAHGK